MLWVLRSHVHQESHLLQSLAIDSVWLLTDCMLGPFWRDQAHAHHYWTQIHWLCLPCEVQLDLEVLHHINRVSWLSKEQVLQEWHKKWNGGQDAELELEESAKLDSDTRQQSKQGQSLFYWYDWTQEPMNTSISCRAVLTWISIWLLCLRKLLLLSLARSKVCFWQGYKSISQKHISWRIQRWDDFSLQIFKTCSMLEKLKRHARVYSSWYD